MPPPAIHGNAKTVLVIDDHEDVRDSICGLLEDSGYETIPAKNGALALVAVQRTRPDVIVLDLMMPVMSGWEVFERLQQSAELATIPVVVVTAGTAEPPPRARVLKKPFAIDALLREIEAACAGAR